MSSSEYTISNLQPSGERYSSITLLHQGGMFAIYTAQNDGRKWILKSVSSDAKGEQEKLRLVLQREYAILQQLDSPYIIRAREIATVDAVGECLVEEYIEGENLDQWLKQGPSQAHRRRVLDELLETMDYLHSKQMVHGDLKPQNILITRNGQHVKLIDFGLSDEDGSIDKHIGCTKAYAAPEQIAGQTTDCRADIYAIGHVMQLLFPHRYIGLRRHCMSHHLGRRICSVKAVQNALKRRSILGKSVLALAVVVLVGWCFMMAADQGRMQREQDAQQSAQQQTKTVLDKLHFRYDSVCAIYRDSLIAYPEDSLMLRYRAMMQREQDAQQSAQQQTKTVLDKLHFRYDSVCAIYRDSLIAYPEDSLMLRYRAMMQINTIHEEAMAQDSAHADEIDKDYFRTYKQLYNQLNTSQNEH